MGYRLNAVSINFVFKGKKNYHLELGKQYDSKWDEFNNYWFGNGEDQGLVYSEDLKEFYTELVAFNTIRGDYKLYNLEDLEEMIDYAIENKLAIYFTSY